MYECCFSQLLFVLRTHMRPLFTVVCITRIGRGRATESKTHRPIVRSVFASLDILILSEYSWSHIISPFAVLFRESLRESRATNKFPISWHVLRYEIQREQQLKQFSLCTYARFANVLNEITTASRERRVL